MAGDGMKVRMNPFPSERINKDYPWALWAIGWMATLKSVLWLAYEPVNLPDLTLHLLGYKNLLFSVPFLICAIGIMNRKRWAVWGLVSLSVIGLLFVVFIQDGLRAYLIESEIDFAITLADRRISPFFTLAALICIGPLGDILILCGMPAMFRNTHNPGR